MRRVIWLVLWGIVQSFFVSSLFPFNAFAVTYVDLLPKNEVVGVFYYEAIGKGRYTTRAGHAAFFLSHYCAETPFKIRRCDDRDKHRGVVIARYGNFSSTTSYDFMAIPLEYHLFGTESEAVAPLIVTRAITEALHEQFYKKFLTSYIPYEIGTDQVPKVPSGNWRDAVGASLRRDITMLLAPADSEQTQAIADFINSSDGASHFNIFLRNCANFVETLMHAGGVKGGRGFLADLFFVTPMSVSKAFRDHYQTIERTQKSADPLYRVIYVPQMAGTHKQSSTAITLLGNFYQNKILWAVAPISWHSTVAATLVDLFSKKFRAYREYRKYGSDSLADLRYEIMRVKQALAYSPQDSELQIKRRFLEHQLKSEETLFFGNRSCWTTIQKQFETLVSVLKSHNVLKKAEADLLLGQSNVTEFLKLFENVESASGEDGYTIKIDGAVIGLSSTNIAKHDPVGAVRLMVGRMNYLLFNDPKNRAPARLIDKDWELLKGVVSQAGIRIDAIFDENLGSCSHRYLKANSEVRGSFFK